jgi:hypothetical protein
MRLSRWSIPTLPLFLCIAVACAQAQDSSAQHPPDYPGVRTHIPGVFITPIQGAPFSGTVEVVSKEILPDASIYVRQTVNHIARNSAGVIYNEIRQLVPPTFQGEPNILSFHIYDPQTRLSTFGNPQTRIARQIVLREQPKTPANATPDGVVANSEEKLTTQDLGTQTVAGLSLRGTRKLRTIPAMLSGTGREVTITDDYWYSEGLRVYLVLRHNDPRTGEQTVGITQVERGEPAASFFQVPSGYKIVDETPVPDSR